MMADKPERVSNFTDEEKSALIKKENQDLSGSSRNWVWNVCLHFNH